MNIQNSFSVGDGLELSVSAVGYNETHAVDNVCNKALGRLLLTDACQVLLQPAQWIVPGDDIVIVATRLKLIYVQRPWTIGDIFMGDVKRLSAIAEQLGPRVQHTFSRNRDYKCRCSSGPMWRFVLRNATGA